MKFAKLVASEGKPYNYDQICQQLELKFPCWKDHYELEKIFTDRDTFRELCLSTGMKKATLQILDRSASEAHIAEFQTYIKYKHPRETTSISHVA